MASVLLLLLVGCRQPASKSGTHPTLLTDEQSKEVLRILVMTDPLDTIIRAGNAGQPYVDLATKVELEYLRCQQTLPQDNAASLEFRRIFDGYTIASSIIAGKATNTRQTPFDLVAEAYVRKSMLRHILNGSASEKEWRAFESAHKETK